MARKRLFTSREAAARVGVAAITLRRWLLAGKVREVSRDRNGWRMFTQADINRIRRYAQRVVPPKKKK